MGYIIHSAKGTTWSNHKYVKKVGNKYYYKDSKGNLVEGEPTEEEETTENTSSTDSKSKSSSKGKANAEKERIKKLADNVMAGKLSQAQLRKSNNGKDYMDVMNAVNSKFKKPSSGGKSSSKDKTIKEKSTSEKKTADKTTKSEESKTTKQTNNTNQVVETKVEENTTPKTEEAKTETNKSTATDNSVSANIKSAVKSVTTITDNDSIYATKNEDGTTTVTVDFQDGTTQTFTLAQTFDVVSKTEKTKKQLTHSTFVGGSYLIHRIW